MDDITSTVVEHFGSGLRDAFSTLDKMQRTFFNVGSRMIVGDRDGEHGHHSHHHEQDEQHSHHRREHHAGMNHPEIAANL